MQHVPIKTVRAQSFVEVATLNCFYHLIPCERSNVTITRVMSTIIVGIYLHLFLSVNIEVDLIWLLSPVVWSFIDLGEVFGDLIIHLNFILKQLHVTMFVLPLNLRYHRVIPSDL
jgi:hypothetical protein